MHCTYASDWIDVFFALLWMTENFAHNKRKRNGIAEKRKPSADINTKLGEYIHSGWRTGVRLLV